jgi:hypothetical protein
MQINICMWILHLLPDALIAWIVNIILIAGAVVTVAGFFVRFIPFVNQYRIPVQIAGILLLTLGVYFEGGYTTEMAWRERVQEVEARLAVAETRSAEVNTEIVTKIVTQTKIVRERGDDIVKYVDREVVKNQEVIRFVENCPIPEIIVNTHNAAALNRPIEEKK